jgi:2-polyprenyl-3-methyl-5-hydroxy-6-metoxy-1,4-benzoquinol methylase
MFIESMIPAFDIRKRLIGARKYEQINKYASRAGKVLDIGCGVGEVIDVFKDNGWHSDAIEVNPSAVAWLKKRGIAVFDGAFDAYPETERYDVIMAWGVVEHVVNPKEFLRKVRRHLIPNGLFVSEVPNGQSMLVDYCRATGSDPGRILMGEQHIVLYAPDSYQALHEEAGFKKLHLQTNGLDIETIMKMKHEHVESSTIFELQDRIDSYLKGDLIRGFWRRGATE